MSTAAGNDADTRSVTPTATFSSRRAGRRGFIQSFLAAEAFAIVQTPSMYCHDCAIGVQPAPATRRYAGDGSRRLHCQTAAGADMNSGALKANSPKSLVSTFHSWTLIWLYYTVRMWATTNAKLACGPATGTAERFTDLRGHRVSFPRV
jgi:hypothetical protein